MRFAPESSENQRGLGLLVIIGLGLGACIGGCEKKEKVLDIKGPGIDIEVNKTSSGTSEVEINSNDHKKLEIDVKK